MFRASEGNPILLSHKLESIQTIPKYKRILAPRLQEIIKDMKNKMSQEFKGPNKAFQYVRPARYPLRVAILVTEKTTSTAESVTLEARQSNKTVIIGTKTKGLLVYIEVRNWELPAYGWRLAFGFARNSNIDNKGLTPDVKIQRRKADWISYASE